MQAVSISAEEDNTSERELEERVPVVVNACASEEAQTRVMSHEEIAALAFSYWRERGFQGGTPEEELLRAGRELYPAAEKAVSTERGNSALSKVGMETTQ